tara:strand:+ start:163 stop:792 length:630 start_codon:yes stop_codon:yes gene_type:complete
MRQHVNPLSKNFHEIELIPSLNELFENPELPLHLDIGCAAGDFLFELALENNKWNYLGIEIREKLVNNAKSKLLDMGIRNLYFAFGNANNIFNNPNYKFLIDYVSSISFNFPDPWYKNKHHKRRVIQPDLIRLLSNSMRKESLIFIKTDVKELFNYMDFTISKNLNFKQLQNIDLFYPESFNPKMIKTNREKYSIERRLNIFQRIYIKT